MLAHLKMYKIIILTRRQSLAKWQPTIYGCSITNFTRIRRGRNLLFVSKVCPFPALTFPSGLFMILICLMKFIELRRLARLVEWVEVLTALGAEKIFVYNLEVHPNMTKV